MNILFIITVSIVIQKCNKILKQLKSNQISINCILTDNAIKVIALKDIQKIIK